MQTNITTWLSLTGPEPLPEFPWFVKLISCSLSSASCRICKLQPALSLELPSVSWPRIRAHSSCPAQLQDTGRAVQQEGTEGPDRNKAKSQSPRGALPPELRDPPDGTALPWTWPSGWLLEQSRAEASWHHQIWYWHSGNTQPWHWSFLVSAISNINLSPYSKFKAKDKKKCKSALTLPLSSNWTVTEAVPPESHTVPRKATHFYQVLQANISHESFVSVIAATPWRVSW